LPAGTHTLRIEMLPDLPAQPANFNKQYGFDCFVLSNDGFAPKGADQNGGPHQLPELPDPKTFGLHLPRTMALLEGSTPEHRNVVTILFYGQSIVANSHIDLLLTKYLREKYPNAEIRFKNTAIGGYEAPTLHRTCWQDLYCENPDLVVFHDYGGETDGTYEEMMKGIQDNLVAEVLSWTHHVDNFGTGIDKQRDASAVFLKEMGAKYHYEMVDLRVLWKEMLRTTHLPEQTFLVDQIHLNTKGSAALLDILAPHFVANPAAGDGWKKRVVDLPLDGEANPPGVTFDAAAWTHVPGGLVAKGTAPLRIAFTGNRLDLCGLFPPDAAPTAKAGTAKILLDGKAPSTLRETLTARRSTIVPGGWWPAVTRVVVADNAVPEKVTLHFRDLAPDGSSFAFDAVGSVSGDEGTGKPGVPFTAKSGRWSIAAEDLALDKLKKITKKDLPPTLDVEFPVESMSLDAWSPRRPPKPGYSNQDVVVRSWTNGPHVVEIVPNGDGPVGVAKAVAYAPGPRD
ncbi:MAG TPA: hypothetical protein VIM58_01745, partial [Candidatus Methylacidiphilales bacterium]